MLLPCLFVPVSPKIQLSHFYFQVVISHGADEHVPQNNKATLSGRLWSSEIRTSGWRTICMNMIKTTAGSWGQKSFHLATEYSSISPLNRAMINWTSSVIKIWMSSFQSLNSQGRQIQTEQFIFNAWTTYWFILVRPLSAARCAFCSTLVSVAGFIS